MKRLLRYVVLGVLLASACTGLDSEPTRDDLSQQPTSTMTTDATAGATDDVEPQEPGRVIDGLDNVDRSVFALGSVWAVTSNLSDEFSPGGVRAGVVRIDPSSGQVDEVLASPGIEPSLTEAGGRLWVKLADRLAGLDPSGVEVVSVPLELGRSDDLASAGGLLWVVLNDQDQILGIDPATGAIEHTLATGDFPVSPVSAFGFVWVPNLIDGTISIIDATADSDARVVTSFVAAAPKFVVPVPAGKTGDEVWVTSTAGDLFAVSAGPDNLGDVRQIFVDRSINTVVAHGDRALLLPTWGTSVLVLDIRTEAVLAEIPIESIPVRALSADDAVWVTGDGQQERLTSIDPGLLTVRSRFRVGSGESDTTGPRQPLVVNDEIWVPNRGDDAFFIVATREP